MRKRTLASGLAAVLIAGPAAIPSAPAHEMGAPERGKELFQPGLEHAGALADDPAGGRPPLYEGLGSLEMRITTAKPEAQAWFNQGWRLTWAFNHAEAHRSFREARRIDPECAMCFWGEAFVLGPNINDGMHDAAIAPAFAALRAAQALQDRVSDKERALIDALAKRYDADASEDRAVLNEAWAHAIGEVARDYPKDVDVLTLYADALMNLQPWDYWEADGATPKGHGGEIVATLETAMALRPDHPGAAHLYIHAFEATAHPEIAEAVADRLRGAMPAAGHLSHMPAHIYVRIGRFEDSIEVNREAIAADEAFLAQAGKASSKLYRFGYYPHNIHYLMVSAQMAGLTEDVIASAEKLAAVTSEDVSKDLAWVQAILTAPYTAHAQFSDPAIILALPDPGDRFPFVQGFWHYARGVGLARSGDREGARNEVRSIERLIADADMSGLEAQYLPARDVLGIARHVVEGRIAQSAGDYRAAEHHLAEAIALEDTIPYMEPPYWYYPVRQTLGAVLLQQGRAEEAAGVFEEALRQLPRNGWALWGLLQSRMAAGERDIESTRTEFEEAWLGDTALLALDRL